MKPISILTRSVTCLQLDALRQRLKLPSATGLKWLKCLLVFSALAWLAISSPGATNIVAHAKKPLVPIGSVQWQIDQQNARERQDQYRKRIVIPQGVVLNIPRASFVFPSVPVAKPAAPMQTHVIFAGVVIKLFCFTILLSMAGLLAIKRFRPQMLDSWRDPLQERGYEERIRTEEESFNEFITKFRVGPTKAVAADVPAVEEDPGQIFYAKAAALLRKQHTLLRDISAEASDLGRQKIMLQLYTAMCELKNAANFPEVLPMWQMASALEGLLKQLSVKIGEITPSTLRSILGGVELLDKLCVPEAKPDLFKEGAIKFLVVDDDRISRHAMTLALKKAFGQPDVAINGEDAIAHIHDQAYDAIFLDVELPGMDGFELCTKIREAGLNRQTPVVFVTTKSDFDARAKSILSGGNDLMGKPFLIFEITVKALTHALQGRLQKRDQVGLPKLDEKDGAAKSLSVNGSHPSSSMTPAHRPVSALRSRVGDRSINAFASRAASAVSSLRDLGQSLLQTPAEETRQSLLAEAFVHITTLLSKNDSYALHPAYQICAALEGLIRKMLENVKHSTPSAQASVVNAVDLLSDLCAPDLGADLLIDPPVSLLVVDDDLVTRRVMTGALQTFFSRPENVENGEDALARAVEKSFDVIFMDVIMPGMDGFQTCEKIRATPLNALTPVVFVTGRGDFQARAEMSRAGGSDLMEKPFLNAEITVRALTLALRGRLEKMKVAS